METYRRQQTQPVTHTILVHVLGNASLKGKINRRHWLQCISTISAAISLCQAVSAYRDEYRCLLLYLFAFVSCEAEWKRELSPRSSGWSESHLVFQMRILINTHRRFMWREHTSVRKLNDFSDVCCMTLFSRKTDKPVFLVYSKPINQNQ